MEGCAREFHMSMRTTTRGRWRKTKGLVSRGIFSEMNPPVPITCRMPFDGTMWRKTRVLLHHIRYFREGFIIKEQGVNLDDLLLDPNFIRDQYHLLKDETVSEKIATVYLIFDKGPDGRFFRGTWWPDNIKSALCDYELSMENDEWLDKPALVTHRREGGGMYIIN